MTQALAAGVTFFQYRNKVGSRRQIYETSQLLAWTAARAGAVFIVNDHADIAAAVDADGVHLGQDDLPVRYARRLLGDKKIIGVSTHSIDQALAAEAAGADYVGFGPLFKTATKDAGAAQGIENLAVIKKTVSVPVIAIGGINQENIGEVMRTRADGAAVISAVFASVNIKSSAEEMIRLMSKFKIQESGGVV
jgi:thiamine-phosphate diphosphorylase